MPTWFQPVLQTLIVILLGIGVAYLRRLTRLVSLFRDYPPHKHVADRILYPPDYAPGRVERF
jgi:hypothetical protein